MKTRREELPQLPELEELRGELYRVRRRSQYRKLLRSTIGMLTATAAAVILAVTLWLPVLQIVGNSMSPTLMEGDVVVCIRDGTPEPGALVSFYLGNKLLVKRCTAGPGQQVEITETGHVLVDGNALEESYVVTLARGEGDTQFPCVVPEGQFFCLGDNRETSVDSRYSAVGFVSREQMNGRPVLRVWPFSRFGLLE